MTIKNSVFIILESNKCHNEYANQLAPNRYLGMKKPVSILQYFMNVNIRCL